MTKFKNRTQNFCILTQVYSRHLWHQHDPQFEFNYNELYVWIPSDCTNSEKVNYAHSNHSPFVHLVTSKVITQPKRCYELFSSQYLNDKPLAGPSCRPPVVQLVFQSIVSFNRELCDKLGRYTSSNANGCDLARVHKVPAWSISLPYFSHTDTALTNSKAKRMSECAAVQLQILCIKWPVDASFNNRKQQQFSPFPQSTHMWKTCTKEVTFLYIIYHLDMLTH